jgi:hypothetical protein
MTTVCTCSWCRRTIRTCIEITWEEHPRWMGVFTARVEGRLGWCPWPLYRDVFAEMVGLGILLASYEAGDEYPCYLLARLTLPALPAPRGPARKGGGR